MSQVLTNYDVHDIASLLAVAATNLPYTTGIERRSAPAQEIERIHRMNRTELLRFMDEALLQLHQYDDSIRVAIDPEVTRFG